MAKGYKRDSRGRFAGGYGAGALGGSGAYAGRQSRGPRGSAAGGGTAKIGQPKPQRTKRVLKAVGGGAKRKWNGLSTRQKTAIVQVGVKGALLGGGYLAATRVMDKGEARIAGGRTLKAGRAATAPYRGAGAGRIEDIGATKTGQSLRSSVSAAAAAVNRTPNYSAAAGTKEYVGRRMKPGDTWGFQMRAARPGR